MENFKQTLKKRIQYLSLYLCAVPVLWGILKLIMESNPNVEYAGEFAHGYAVGIAFVVLILIIKYSFALRSDEKLKALYIKEKDERQLMIKVKVGGVCTTIILVCVSFASLIAAFFNQIVFLTLLGVTLFISLLMIALRLYYNKVI